MADQDQDATLDDAETPDGATSDDQTEDTAEATEGAQQSVDWEARYKALQGHATKVEQRLAILERGDDSDEEAGDEGESEGEPAPLNQRAIDESWRLAEAVHGSEAITAYERVHPILSRAETPADWIAVLEAYHEARAQGATPKEAKRAAAKSAPQQTAQVETNRSDGSPDITDLDRKAVEAKSKGNLRGWLDAVTQQVTRG